MSKEIIYDFCQKLLPDFLDLLPKLKQLHPEWAVEDLAGNLMEFGRGQISEIDEPTEKEISFYQSYTSSLNFENERSALYAAYAAGCIMGLVQSGQLVPDQFMDSIGLSRQYAE